MTSRLGIAVAICLCFAGGASAADVVRFETTMGNFDMVLNPTNNSVLQGHVDNMLEYIKRETYNGTWINRADTGFVLQMGGFYSQTKRPQLTSENVRSIRGLSPVEGEPAAENSGLSNTVGTVALALSGLATGGTNQNSGSSSFFINMTSNDFLDADFTVFAAISDMTVINNIMALQTLDRTQDPVFGADSGNLGFTDVPVQTDGNQVFIKRAYQITDTMTIARALDSVQSVMSQSAQSFADSAAAGAAASSSGISTSVVPEPASLVTGICGLFGYVLLGSRRRRS